jgi:hypothetical protein
MVEAILEGGAISTPEAESSFGVNAKSIQVYIGVVRYDGVH